MHNDGQLSIEEFHVPFGGMLDPDPLGAFRLANAIGRAGGTIFPSVLPPRAA